MSYRFFHSQPPVDDRFQLASDQAHHAINVMRYREGDRIVIFDGFGREHDALIETLSKKKLTAKRLETRQFDRSLSRSITIVVALPKGDRQKFLIEKLVELGVTKLIPLATSRSVAEVTPKAIERIEKQIIEASKQCGRNFLMQIASPSSIPQLCNLPDADVLGDQTSDQAETLTAIPNLNVLPKPTAEPLLKLMAHPYDSKVLSDVALESTQPVAIAIGPEGGFSDSEVTQLSESGWQPVSLGPTILRIETAAIAAATIFGIGKHVSAAP